MTPLRVSKRAASGLYEASLVGDVVTLMLNGVQQDVARWEGDAIYYETLNERVEKAHAAKPTDQELLVSFLDGYVGWQEYGPLPPLAPDEQRPDYQCNGELKIVSFGQSQLDAALRLAGAWAWGDSFPGFGSVYCSRSAFGVICGHGAGLHNPDYMPQWRELDDPLSPPDAAKAAFDWFDGKLSLASRWSILLPARQGLNLTRLPAGCVWPPEPLKNARRWRELRGAPHLGRPFIRGWQLTLGGYDGLVSGAWIWPRWMCNDLDAERYRSEARRLAEMSR